MKKVWLVLLILFGSVCVSFAATDYNCVKKCKADGQLYSNCKASCSYAGQASYRHRNSNRAARVSVDYPCLNTCKQKGNTYNYCKSRCSFRSGAQYSSPQSLNDDLAIDYECIQDCSHEGFHYGYCKSQCSYNSVEQTAPSDSEGRSRIDYPCINECTVKGLPYGECRQKCSFNDYRYDNIQQKPLPQTAKKEHCQQQCKNSGYTQKFCNKKCPG